MTRKELLFIVLAIFWVVILFIVFKSFFKAPESKKIEVLMATNAISTDKALSEKDVHWQTVPESQVQMDDIKKGTNLSRYLGRNPLVAIQANQVIKSSYFPSTDINRLAQLIRPGMYAMTVELNKNNDDNLFIVPGDNVDVFLTRTTKQKGGVVTQLLLSDLRVLAVDAKPIKEFTKTTAPAAKLSALKTMTLEVNKEQAQRLTLGISMGTLTFVLHEDSHKKTKPLSKPLYGESLDTKENAPVIEYHGSKVIGQ